VRVIVGSVQALRQKEQTFVKRLVLLTTATLVALLILVPIAGAQEKEETVIEEEAVQEETTMSESTQPLPASGGLPVGSVLLPAAALLVGSGIFAYAVLRGR
jgi:hypothetical protein